MRLLALAAVCALAPAAAFEYAVVCDAGSTGTRAYVYQLAPGTSQAVAQNAGKVKPGLSTFAEQPASAAPYLLELLGAAERLVPAEKHGTTPLFVFGTAGMRLLPWKQQDAVWDAAFAGLEPRSPFLLRRQHFATLSGNEEGWFGLLAVNHLTQRVGADLIPAPTSAGLVGALDLGGSSTQIAFLPPGEGEGAQHRSSHPGGRLRQGDAYIHSYLGLGAELARQRLEQDYALQASASGAASTPFPCYFAGYRLEVELEDGAMRPVPPTAGWGIVLTAIAAVCAQAAGRRSSWLGRATALPAPPPSAALSSASPIQAPSPPCRAR